MQAGMQADPEWYDAKIAGWWGGGLRNGLGPVGAAVMGRGVWMLGNSSTWGTRGGAVNWQLVHLGNAGQGVNLGNVSTWGTWGRASTGNASTGERGQGVNRQRVHLGNAGQGVNRQRDTESLYEYMRELADRLRLVRCLLWRLGAGSHERGHELLARPWASSLSALQHRS